MAMAVSMAAMMAPSAAPFFLAYGRDTRRPAAVAVAAVVYVAVWAAIGFAVDALMNQLMMPTTWQIVAAAVVVAALYSLSPWSRWARARCQEMCGHAVRGGALAGGAVYAACCVICSAGIMAALVVVGMSNLTVIVLGAIAMFVYKFSGWGALRQAWRA